MLNTIQPIAKEYNENTIWFSKWIQQCSEHLKQYKKYKQDLSDEQQRNNQNKEDKKEEKEEKNENAIGLSEMGLHLLLTHRILILKGKKIRAATVKYFNQTVTKTYEKSLMIASSFEQLKKLS